MLHHDELTGLEAVSRDEEGFISCFSNDALARYVASKIRDVDGQGSSQPAKGFLGTRTLLMDANL